MLRYVKSGMMLLSIAYIVIGMMLLIMPQTSLLWICYAFGAVVLITGKGRETRQKRGLSYITTPSDVDYVQELLKFEY